MAILALGLTKSWMPRWINWTQPKEPWKAWAKPWGVSTSIRSSRRPWTQWMRPPTKSRKPWGRWASTSPRWTTSNFVLHLEPDTGYNLPISAPPNDVSTPFLLCLLAEQQAAAALAASCSCTLDRIFRKHSEDERFCEFSAYKTSFPRLLVRTSSSWISRPVCAVRHRTEP